MKKKIFSAAFVVAITLTAGYNVYNSQNKEALSDLALDNVEALANDEADGGPDYQGHKKAFKGGKECCTPSESYCDVCPGYLPAC